MKKAPPGYYTAKQARERLGMNESTFSYQVRHGHIPRYKPPTSTREGIYDKEVIEAMVTANTLYAIAHRSPQTVVRSARPEDAQGIYEVLASFGWKTATVEQRLAWYKMNPFLDFVAIEKHKVLGYVTAVPYKPSAMEAIMAGRRRAWDMTPEDIHRYQAGKIYSVYVGIAMKKDTVYDPLMPRRLLNCTLEFFVELAKLNITIHSLHGVSDQKQGQRLATHLGFVREPAQPHDLFPRYSLDLYSSPSPWAVEYREAVKAIQTEAEKERK